MWLFLETCIQNTDKSRAERNKEERRKNENLKHKINVFYATFNVYINKRSLLLFFIVGCNGGTVVGIHKITRA